MSGAQNRNGNSLRDCIKRRKTFRKTASQSTPPHRSRTSLTRSSVKANEWGTAEVEFTVMTTDSDGRVVIPLPDHPGVWSAKPLGDERRELGGVDGPTIPLALLMTGRVVVAPFEYG
jgi:hypothetical protein